MACPSPSLLVLPRGFSSLPEPPAPSMSQFALPWGVSADPCHPQSPQPGFGRVALLRERLEGG